MFSWEIDNLMEQHDYNLPSTVYLDICSTSPQIERTEFNTWSNRFDIHDSDGNSWNFSVYHAG